MFGVSVGMAGQTHKRQHTPTNSGDVACAEYRPMTHEQMFYEERGRRLALEQAQIVKSILVVNVCSKYARALTFGECVCVVCMVWAQHMVFLQERLMQSGLVPLSSSLYVYTLFLAHTHKRTY